jgi:hypothetical protein
MGILADSVKDDVAAFNYICECSLKAWRVFSGPLPQNQRLDVEINDTLLPLISQIGGDILSAHFSEPEFLERIATFVVLSNSCPYFKLWRNRKPVTDPGERRTFVAKLSCSFVHTALRLFTPPGGDQVVYCFRGFKTSPRRFVRFLSYLQILDGLEIKQSGASEGLSKRAKMVLTKDIIAVWSFLDPEIYCVQENPEGGERLLLESFDGSGAS